MRALVCVFCVHQSSNPSFTCLVFSFSFSILFVSVPVALPRLKSGYERTPIASVALAVLNHPCHPRSFLPRRADSIPRQDLQNQDLLDQRRFTLCALGHTLQNGPVSDGDDDHDDDDGGGGGEPPTHNKYQKPKTIQLTTVRGGAVQTRL